MFQFEDPYKVPRSAPKLRKGGVLPVTIAVHPPLELLRDAVSDLNQQRLHLRIARLGESNRADWTTVITIYSIVPYPILSYPLKWILL